MAGSSQSMSAGVCRSVASTSASPPALAPIEHTASRRAASACSARPRDANAPDLERAQAIYRLNMGGLLDKTVGIEVVDEQPHRLDVAIVDQKAEQPAPRLRSDASVPGAKRRRKRRIPDRPTVPSARRALAKRRSSRSAPSRRLSSSETSRSSARETVAAAPTSNTLCGSTFSEESTSTVSIG
jgi:hypothetical protein